MLPKETGMRPIVNLAKRADGGSINDTLKAAFHILTYEKV